MELLQLYYFQKVARLQHISLAARQLNIAQPALSQSIKRLENELGVPLFDRVGKNIVLNKQGSILLKYTNSILSSLNNCKKEIEDSYNASQNMITLSIQAASSLIPGLLQEFRNKYPDTHFQLLQHKSDTQPTSSIDLFIKSSTEFSSSENSKILLKEQLLVALPKTHPLAQKPSVCLASLYNESFINLSEGTQLYAMLLHFCNMAGFNPNITLFSDNPNTLRDLIKLNFGIALLPEKTWNNVCAESIVKKKITDYECLRYIVLSHNPSSYLTERVRAFQDFTIQYFYQFDENINSDLI